MAILILVHGAFQGGFVWRKIVPLLKVKGHVVYCPTLKGLGNRSSELSANIGLKDHIDDVCKVIDDNKLEHVILVGHSYGGIVISGVAKERFDAINGLIYVDTPIPENNQSLLDILGVEAASVFINSAEKYGDNWLVNTFPPIAFGLNIEHHEWAISQHSPQSLKSFTDKVSTLSTEQVSLLHIGYIQCIPSNPFTDIQVQHARKRKWKVFQIESGHCPMITHPQQFFELLCNYILSIF